MNTDLYKFQDQIIRKSHLCDKDKEAFTAWESYLNEDEEKNLVAEGEDELIELGERYQMRFPDLLSEQYDNSTYKVRPSNDPSAISKSCIIYKRLYSFSSNSPPPRERNEAPKDSPRDSLVERIYGRSGTTHPCTGILSSASTSSATLGGRM